MQASTYQTAVYDHFKNDGPNAAIISVAGSGKTTTAIEGIGQISNMNQVLLGAFNVSIRDEFRERCLKKGLNHVRCMTYNGFGFGICAKNMRGSPQLDPDKTAHVLEFDVLNPQSEQAWAQFSEFRPHVIRLISLAKNLNIHGVKHAWGSWGEIADHHAMDVPDDDCFFQVVQKTFERCNEVMNYFDFDDQKYMPIHHDWPIPKYDVVVLDEFQDTCPLEMELLKRATGSRMYVFGDPDQAIYGFKGATPDAFPKFKSEMNGVELPLSICYRCPKSVVRAAQAIVPRIEAAPNAIEGSVETVKNKDVFEQAKPLDFILCRTTDDLVSLCLKYIRAGKTAFVRGRDFAKGLEYIINKVSGFDEYMPVGEFITRLLDYEMTRSEQLTRLRRERELLTLSDRVNTIRALADAASDVAGIKKAGLMVFTDIPAAQHGGIDMMTIHKSKGLQSKNVWILRPDLLPHPRSANSPWMSQEEQRLKYVAITRATENLRWVNPKSE